ncbi:MAG: TolC family protein [Saprospiraceae bacterium]|nr:TolC family protein [Saprospiraceae bacterium]
MHNKAYPYMMKPCLIKQFTVLSVLLISGLLLHAQEELALRMLEAEVLEANLNRKIAAKDKGIAVNNYDKGNAGLLPTVNLALRNNTTYITNTLTTADGREIVNDFTLNNNVNANVNAEIAIYNGGRNKNLYERLRMLTETADINERIVIENLLYNLRTLYYQAVRQKQLIKTTRAALDFTEQRLQLAVNKLDIGTGNKVVVLQTELEKNQLLAELELQNLSLLNIYDQINALRNLPPSSEVPVTDSTYVIKSPDKNTLKSTLLENNLQFKMADINIALALNSIEDVKGLRKPSVTANLGYTFNRADNGAGFFLLNQSNGFGAGVAVTMPIYDANRIKIQYRNAQLQSEQAAMQKELLQINLDAQFEQLFRTYEASERLASLQKKNVDIAEENLIIGINRFKVGVTDGFELEQIQQGYTQANFRWIDALFQTKMNELELMRLTGKLAIY